MVGIEYTGVDGETTRFGSNSADEAMGRLRGIKGYNGNIMDSAAAGLANAFLAAHKNKSRVQALSQKQTALLNGSTGVFSGANGRVSRIPSVTDVRMEAGRLIVNRQDRFVGEDGRVVQTGNTKTETINL